MSLKGAILYSKNEKTQKYVDFHVKIKEIGDFTVYPSQKVLMNGFSIVKYSDGEVYIGNIANNRRTKGEYIGKKGIYIGDFIGNERAGFGIFIENSGNKKILSYYNNGKMVKYCVFYMKGNRRYLEGIVKNSEIVVGCIYYMDKMVRKIEGYIERKDDRYRVIGYGVIYLANKRIIECDVRYIYNGYILDYSENKRYFGKITYSDESSMYEGEIQGVHMHGYGILYGKGVKIYEGEFYKGKYHGWGVLYEDKERVYEGGFVNGMKNGVAREGRMGDEDYEVGIWENDKKKKVLMVKNGGNKIIKVF